MGGGVSLPWVYVHSSIYETYLVWWFPRDLCLIGWEGGVSLPWVYVHSAIYLKLIQCSGFPEIYTRLEERGWGQSAMGICAFFYI